VFWELATGGSRLTPELHLNFIFAERRRTAPDGAALQGGLRNIP
jgi:hypothetical protein